MASDDQIMVKTGELGHGAHPITWIAQDTCRHILIIHPLETSTRVPDYKLLGEQRVKNIEKPVRTCRVLLDLAMACRPPNVSNVSMGKEPGAFQVITA